MQGHMNMPFDVCVENRDVISLSTPDDFEIMFEEAIAFWHLYSGSDVFEVGGYEWKLEMYPYGDSQVATPPS